MSMPSELLSQLLDLPVADRAEIACRLLLSLEPEGPERDPDWEESWKAEIEARLLAIDEGRTTLIPWEEVRDRLRQSLSTGPQP